jgi:hypothetical protein
MRPEIYPWLDTGVKGIRSINFQNLKPFAQITNKNGPDLG